MPVRSQQLDVLRGVAILLVLCRHYVAPPWDAGRLTGFARVVVRFGWTGVDLFFVLSGFLIGGLLFAEIARTRMLGLKRFYLRRAFKIWPAYFAFLAFVAVLRIQQHMGVGAALEPLWPNILHLQNFLGTPELHTWSLAVEEHFYLLLPVLLLVLCRLGGVHLVPFVVAAVCIGGLALRIAKLGTTFSLFTHLTPTQLRIDSLAFGVLLAYLYCLRPTVLSFVPSSRVALIAIGLLLISPMLKLELRTPFVWTIGFTLLYLGYGCILLACLDATTGWLGRLLTGRLTRPIALIGVFSYSIYLWHPLIARQFFNRHPQHWHGAIQWTLYTAAYFIASILIGILAAKLIEQPCLWLRDRWIPARTIRPRFGAPATAEPSAATPGELSAT